MPRVIEAAVPAEKTRSPPTARSVTAGVMIALSLVPTAAIVGISLVSGNLATLGVALSRWAMEAVGVVAFSLLVFVWKRNSSQKRDMV